VLNIGACLQNTGSKQNVQFLMGGSADEAFNAEFMAHQRSKDVPEVDLNASFPIPFDRFLLPNELMGRFTRVGTNLDAFVSVGTGTSIPLKDQYREGFEADIRKAGTKPAISERMIPASLWAVNITDKGPTSLRSAELQELFDYVCGIFDGMLSDVADEVLLGWRLCKKFSIKLSTQHPHDKYSLEYWHVKSTKPSKIPHT